MPQGTPPPKPVRRYRLDLNSKLARRGEGRDPPRGAASSAARGSGRGRPWYSRSLSGSADDIPVGEDRGNRLPLDGRWSFIADRVVGPHEGEIEAAVVEGIFVCIDNGRTWAPYALPFHGE